MECSKTFEHEHVNLRIAAENLCPRLELISNSMIVLREELVLT
ncbi:hypothetical protein EDC02_1567 [Micromonospora sp. Llam0]|nr:hypothetical protein EDC02_1567 [Micromonospora sp. Llam0]